MGVFDCCRPDPKPQVGQQQFVPYGAMGANAMDANMYDPQQYVVADARARADMMHAYKISKALPDWQRRRGEVMPPSAFGAPTQGLLGRTRSLNFTSILCVWFARMVLFAAITYAVGWFTFDQGLMVTGAFLLLAMIAVCGNGRNESGSTASRMFTGFERFMHSWGWVILLAYGWGFWLHSSFIRPYTDIRNLNTYPNVHPSVYKGAQLMDAGEIEFIDGSHLDLTKSMGFKNGDVFCVAPIVGPDQTPGNTTKLETYEFWAIGTNCCSGHKPDYHCGEYISRTVRKGLRLMRDDMRNNFRLAVEEAKAAYNIESQHPIFMYWMQNPSDEINQYQDDGYTYFFVGVFAFLVLEILLLTCYLCVPVLEGYMGLGISQSSEWQYCSGAFSRGMTDTLMTP